MDISTWSWSAAIIEYDCVIAQISVSGFDKMRELIHAGGSVAFDGYAHMRCTVSLPDYGVESFEPFAAKTAAS